MNKHLPQLDGLRGIAILIVLLGHLVVFHFGLGIGWLGPLPPVGVDLFFVLSGFLITRILLDSRQQAHYFRNFYARRALRIWPLYFVVLAVLFTVTNHKIAELSFDENRLHWQTFVFYLQNLTHRQGFQMGPLALAITWSLAVEEQFYMIWPLLVRYLSISALTFTLSTLIVFAPFARFIAPRFGIDPYINPLCRFDAMAVGGLIAIWLSVSKPSKLLVLKVSCIAILSAVTLECLAYYAGVTRYFSKTMLSLAFGAGLLAVLRSALLARLLSPPWLRFTGKVSYCLYLSHALIAAVIFTIFPGVSPFTRGARVLGILLASYGVAAISWKMFEKPLLELKKYFPAATVPVWPAEFGQIPKDISDNGMHPEPTGYVIAVSEKSRL